MTDYNRGATIQEVYDPATGQLLTAGFGQQVSPDYGRIRYHLAPITISRGQEVEVSSTYGREGSIGVLFIVGPTPPDDQGLGPLITGADAFVIFSPAGDSYYNTLLRYIGNRPFSTIRYPELRNGEIHGTLEFRALLGGHRQARNMVIIVVTATEAVEPSLKEAVEAAEEEGFPVLYLERIFRP